MAFYIIHQNWKGENFFQKALIIIAISLDQINNQIELLLEIDQITF